MQDRASIHTAHVVTALLHEIGIEVMDQLPYSPDLNPIENLWVLIKARIYELHPELEFADDTVETLEALIEAAKEAQHDIEPFILHNLCTTMPHKVEAIIKAQGWYTKY